jgi:hypothetical protein
VADTKASDKQRIPEFCFYAVLEELSFGPKMMLRLVHAAHHSKRQQR